MWTSRSPAWSWVRWWCVEEHNNPCWLWYLLHDILCTYAASRHVLAWFTLVSRNCFVWAEFNCSSMSCLSDSAALLVPEERCTIQSRMVFCHSGRSQFRNWPCFHSVNLGMLVCWRCPAIRSASLEAHPEVCLSAKCCHHCGGTIQSRRAVSTCGQIYCYTFPSIWFRCR